MKHIFLIHSHTLLLTSLGVIAKEKISKEEVIFIYSRNYKSCIPVDYESYDLSKEIEDTFYVMFSWSRRHFVYSRKNRNKSVSFFDNFIREHAPVGYYLYVCQLQAFANQILATNRLCKECFFIQEGGRVMTPLLSSRISWFLRVYNAIVLRGEKRLWKMSNWFPNDTTPYNKPIKAFAFDPEYFGKMPIETVNVFWPKIDVDIKLDEQRPIFVLEGAVELGQIDFSTYYNSVKKLVLQFAKPKNYIKFHPKNSFQAKQKYLDIFKSLNIEVEELPMNVPFELILVKYSNLTLVGFGTSLLFYGKAMGHQVISKEEYLMSSRRYRYYVKGLQKL